jgi:hypothetical protein
MKQAVSLVFPTYINGYYVKVVRPAAKDVMA